MFESLCGISYLGDIRMGFAEDKHKVRRIVEGSWDPLQQLYKPAMEVCCMLLRWH
jgi:translocator assembly and maintenance protein 41